MNADDCGGLIGGSCEHAIEFDATKEGTDSGRLFVAVGERRVIVFRGGHLEVLFEFRDFARQFRRQFEFLLDFCAFTKRCLSLGLFVPEAWREGLVGQFREKAVEFRDVKDAPLAPQSAFQGPRQFRVFR
jgi:hypothetical protein